MEVTKLQQGPDEDNFQKYSFDKYLGVCPTTRVANTISTAYETAPPKDGVFLKDFFAKRFRGMQRLIK